MENQARTLVGALKGYGFKCASRHDTAIMIANPNSFLSGIIFAGSSKPYLAHDFAYLGTI